MFYANKIICIAPNKQTIKFISAKLKSLIIDVQYFFCYKTVFFFFQNNPKNLDPSYKRSRSLRLFRKGRLLGLFRKGKTRIIATFR